MSCVLCSYRKAARLALLDTGMLAFAGTGIAALLITLVACVADLLMGHGAADATAEGCAVGYVLFLPAPLVSIWWSRIGDVRMCRRNAGSFGNKCPCCWGPIDKEKR